MEGSISRQMAIDAVNSYLKLSEVSKTVRDMTSIQEVLQSLPSAEPEIIQCRECIHNAHPERTHADCNKFYGMTDQNGFCHEGKRRTDGNA